MFVYYTLCFVVATLFHPARAKLPETYKYGTNIGGWLVSEHWMNPDEWITMGGEYCPKECTSCVSTDWSLAQKLGQEKANEVYQKHWQSWFTKSHILQLKQLGLDHVRIVLGFWIIEELVESPAELYARGGWMELKRGLRQLGEEGFHVTLDMHAMPGVAASKQLFAGKCTSDMQFYQDHNYQRALTWSAILTSMSHLDPDFSSVVAIQCINEPHFDVQLTPGLEQYYSDFVTITRVIEYAMDIKCEVDLQPSLDRLSNSPNARMALEAAIPLISIYAAKGHIEVDPKISKMLKKWASGDSSHSSVRTTPARKGGHRRKSRSTGDQDLMPGSALGNTTKSRVKLEFPVAPVLDSIQKRSYTVPVKSCVTTMVMSQRWQWKGNGASMVKHALGPAAYDDHEYFAFGGVADPDFKSYMTKICNLKAYRKAKQLGEIPYGHGEFSLGTNFNATRDELRSWGDAQRFMYNQEHFWTFWNFRLGVGTEANLPQHTIHTWSYVGAVEAGIWPRDPKEYYNPSVCEAYKNNAED